MSLQQACQAVKAVLKAAEPRRGGSTGYTAYHVVQALRLLSQEPPVGRPRLQRELGIGEAAAKTLLSRLERLGLAEKVPGGRGHRASQAGIQYHAVLSRLIRFHRLRASPLGDSYALVTGVPEPVRDLVGVYHVRDYLVAEECRVSIIGGVEAGVPHYPGIPGGEAETLTAWDPGVERGVVVIVPRECLGKAYTGLLRLIMREYCGDT